MDLGELQFFLAIDVKRHRHHLGIRVILDSSKELGDRRQPFLE
jgi:hypothetical protein